MSEHPSAFSEFSRTIWAKVLGVLTVIMMVLGIYVEFITSWRGTSEGITAQAVAREAALRQDAERREKQALADLAAIKASNAPQRDKGEAQKLEGEGQTAQATAKYADARQRAEADKAKAEAISAAANATINARVAAAVAASGGDMGKVVSSLQGAISDPFDFSAKPRRQADRSFGDLTQRSYDAFHYRVDGNRSPATSPTEVRYDDLTDDCKAKYNQWIGQPNHAAFLAREGGQCVYSFGEPSQDAAIASAMNVCTRKGYACQIIAAK
jgi:hypothetical protein